jgi:glycosyltransferase involved in cell wall biosynthesis
VKKENIPLVSIVIPTYDQKPEYLLASIRSALDQTYPNLEILISNNHSTNGTEKLLNQINDPRVVVVMPETHLSLNEHFNFAAAQAKGDHISFLSSDDLIYPGCIEKTMALMIADKSLVMVYNENLIIDAKGDRTDIIRRSKLPTGVYSKKHTALRMLNNSEYWVIGSVLKKEAFLKEKLVAGIIATDWILGFKLLKYGKVGYVNEPLAAIRFHEREGTKRVEYDAMKREHFRQVPYKYGYLIDDDEFVNAVGLTKEELERYRDEALIINCVILLRKYKAGEIELKDALELVQGYKKHSDNKWIGRFERNFEGSFGLLMTYTIGAVRRIKRIALKTFTKNIY